MFVYIHLFRYKNNQKTPHDPLPPKQTPFSHWAPPPPPPPFHINTPGVGGLTTSKPVPLHPPLKPLRPRPLQTQPQRLLHPPLPPPPRRRLHRILQDPRGRIHPRQLRHHLRAPRRNDGFRLPADHGIQDPPGVHHAGITQARGPGAPAHRRHQRRQLAERRHPVPEERGVFGCH